ncbi:uncharacterized protein [Typha latifolia]|uniref:uncharacterized protein n=1 Tax=Typha latifolia TaxID=4733 RepID=UPI003C2E4C05
MDLLEMPLEAFAFRLYSLPAAGGSILAWLAVIAAAVSLWRIRAVGSRSDASPLFQPPPQARTAAPPPSDRERDQPEPEQKPIASSACRRLEAGSPKVRFTAYYDGRCRVGDGGDEERETEADDDVVSDGVEVGDGEMTAPLGWEGVAIRRKVDFAWYRYQDMTALNGSIVRLWDGNGELTASPRRRGKIGIYY